MKKAAIYDPYINTMGGGEKYLLTIAETLLENNWQVDLFCSYKGDLAKTASDRFHLNLNKIEIKPDIFKKGGMINFFKKFKISSQYHLFFYLNDGSIPFLFSKNNILHIQVPFDHQPKLSTQALNFIKLLFFKNIIVNSRFTQQRAKALYKKNSIVLYPPIDTESFTPGPKDNIILSVGRFDNVLNTKKQDVMIEAFSRLCNKNHLKNWKYVLIGGSLLPEDQNNYLKHLKYIAKDLPIEFYVNVNFTTLKDFYSKSKIFWHAAGYGVDEQKNPQQTEHFGMSTVEAMAAGLVPVVVNKGGLKETVIDKTSGYLWQTTDDLVAKTMFLIDQPQEMSRLAQNAITSSQKFSKIEFKKNFLNIIK